MGKRQHGKSNRGHHTKAAGNSPRFRANQQIELKKQEDADRDRKARRRPDMVSSVTELFKKK
jgi:hypothetical protein